jgi:quercetin dioxygenase-like cupin family protein
MKSFPYSRGLLAAALFIIPGSAQADELAQKTVTPEEMQWQTFPTTGNVVASIVGDSRKPGVYVFRVKLPSNLKIQPHSHRDERVGMVISGTLLVGYGEQFDESKMKVLPAGSIWTEPAGQPHFVWAKDGEVIIQLVGNGPSDTTQVRAKP